MEILNQKFLPSSILKRKRCSIYCKSDTDFASTSRDGNLRGNTILAYAYKLGYLPAISRIKTSESPEWAVKAHFLC